MIQNVPTNVNIINLSRYFLVYTVSRKNEQGGIK